MAMQMQLDMNGKTLLATRQGSEVLVGGDTWAKRRVLAASGGVWAKGLDMGCYSWGNAYLSSTGGHGVQWAREVTQADIIISVGRLTDRTADVVLDATSSPEDAVQALIRQVRAKVGKGV